MNQYFAVLKRNQVLFPASAAEFSANLFALKEELKALLADNPEAKDKYTQVAIEVAIDLQSAIADWVLVKLIDDETRVAASEELLKFAADEGASEEALAEARKEIAAIAESATKKMCDAYREGKLNTVWGHDYTSGLEHSMRRGARWVTTNPCKITGFKKDYPEHYAALIAEVKRENPGAEPSVLAAQVFTKICAMNARAMRPIYKVTNREYGFVCMQVDPRNIKDTQAMIDQVRFWQKAMAKELNTDDPNVVYKLPAVAAAKPAAKVLLEEGYKLCMTLNFSITQHAEFAEILCKGGTSEYLVEMAGQLDDKIANELAAMGYEDAKVIARHGSEAVMRKSYKMLRDKGYKNISIMSAAVRGPWHIQNSMAPVDGPAFLITTVNGKINEFDANPTPLKSVIDEPVEEKYLEVLNKSKVFRQAICDPEEGLLKEEDLYEFPPFAGFLSDFVNAYQEVEDDCR